MKKILLLALIAILATACSKEETNEKDNTSCAESAGFAPIDDKIKITQGIYGTVSFTEGDCMPTIIPSQNSCRTCPVIRTVRIYEYTTLSNATLLENIPNSFYKNFKTKMVAETKSDANGFFQFTLAPGNYTIIVVENGALYAPFGDGQGGIFPVAVGTGTSEVNFPIKYKAIY